MTYHSRSSHTILSAAVLTLSTPALAQHADVWFSSTGSSLTTAGWDHLTGEIINPTQRVFEGEFGLDPVFPFSGDDPGIGSDLLGVTLSMNLYQGLDVWNGSSFQGSTAAGLRAGYGGQEALSTTGGAFSFLVQSGLDLHPEYTLFGIDGSDPVEGLYLATFSVSAVNYDTSASFWVVFNLGMSEEEHGAAIAWVEANLVPAPSACVLLILAGRFGRRSRHRYG